MANTKSRPEFINRYGERFNRLNDGGFLANLNELIALLNKLDNLWEQRLEPIQECPSAGVANAQPDNGGARAALAQT
nr:hypothetical protein [Phragmitibacter flavus]